MPIRAYVDAALVVTLGICALTGVVHADDPIASLNRSIQDRFKDVDTLFGLRRIVVIGDTPHRFKPENVAELSAVHELESARLRVALYVAGRRVLDREPDLTTKTPFALNRRVIFGPVNVTSQESADALPAATDLIEESRIAFRTLLHRDRHDFALGDWTFTARAVRAATEQCLTCHRGQQVGDPLGVVLYAYQLLGARRPGEGEDTRGIASCHIRTGSAEPFHQSGLGTPP